MYILVTVRKRSDKCRNAALCDTCSTSTAGTSPAVLKESGPFAFEINITAFLFLVISQLYYEILSPCCQCFSVCSQRGFQAVYAIKSSRSDSIINKERGRYAGMAWPVE